MSANWYAIYTRPEKEKRVAAALGKKGIECYCPQVPSGPDLKKPERSPLFRSLLFVNIDAIEINRVVSISGIINIAYWQSRPAIISTEEIDLIKKITGTYDVFSVEKTVVNTNGSVKLLEKPAIAFTENTISVQYNRLKVNLPSLGYAVTAERLKQKAEKPVSLTQKELVPSFSERVSAFLFN